MKHDKGKRKKEHAPYYNPRAGWHGSGKLNKKGKRKGV